MRPLVSEWLLELQVMGRSQRTIGWYRQKTDWYLDHEDGPESLDGLTGAELKRLLAGLQARGLAPNTVHGFYEVIRAFANWAAREGYPVDPSVLRVRGPKVPQTEIETYSDEQLMAIFNLLPAGWARLAVQILLGTGIRVSELAALNLDDIDDDEDETFLKIMRGKGAKFRRVPVSSRLRRDLVRYVNRDRPDVQSRRLLILPDGRPVNAVAVINLMSRIRRSVGFGVRAHRFRHTFATRYLRNGGRSSGCVASSAIRAT